jgi:VIT1/CCC1 family predicted Fe2+/Mn2+ transporter
MKYFDLEGHLAREHKRTALSVYLREIVYGGNDGIVTTFAVVAGFAGATQDPTRSSIPFIAVLIFGLANLFADALSMSLGSFLSLRSDQDMYRKERRKEIEEIRDNPKAEVEESVEILTRKGFSEKDARTITSLYQKNQPYWIEFMMKDELEMSNPEHESPVFIALSTFASFVLFGIIPLLPYFLRIPGDTFQYSIMATAAALILLGVLRSNISRIRPILAVSETVVVGGVAAVVAYMVGTFFRI